MPYESCSSLTICINKCDFRFDAHHEVGVVSIEHGILFAAGGALEQNCSERCITLLDRRFELQEQIGFFCTILADFVG